MFKTASIRFVYMRHRRLATHVFRGSLEMFGYY